MPTIDPVILQLRADVQRYRSELRSTTTIVDRQLAQQQRTFQNLSQQVQSSSNEIGGTIKNLAGIFAAYLSGNELIGLIDSFTKLQNNLRVAGVEGDQLSQVQDRLFASAQKYGVSLEGLSGLFGALTQASKELGASQEEVFRLTDAVSAALKVSGSSATEASGALQQLGQALRAPTVQAEEYNSLLDGLFPLLQAAADGSDKYGGSVGKLTAAVKAGQVTSKEFFSIILKGADTLDKRAAAAAQTLSGAFTSLNNALTVYVGEAATVNGGTAAIVAGISALADNLNTIIPALVTIGTALGVGFVTNAASAAIAARGAGAAMLAAFGGPVGLAITALAIGIGSLAVEAYKTEQIVKGAIRSYEELRNRLDATRIAAAGAASGSASVGNDALGAIPKVNAFAGAVGNLAQQLYNQARAAKAARVEKLKTDLSGSQRTELDLSSRSPGGRAEQRGRARSALLSGDVLGFFGQDSRARVAGSLSSLLSNGRTDREIEQGRRAAAIRSRTLQGDLNRELAQPVSAGDLPGGGGTVGTSIDAKAVARHESVLKGLRRRAETARGKELKTVTARIAREESIIADLRRGTDQGEAAAAAPPGSAGGAGRAGPKKPSKAEEASKVIAAIKDDLRDLDANIGATILTESERLDRASRQFQGVFGREGSDYTDPFAGVEGYDRQRAIDSDLMGEAEREAQAIREDNVRSLADLYTDLFTRGTGDVWRNFQEQGLRTLALVLAQASVASFSAGGGGFGSLLKNISSGFSSANPFGRASGGYVGPGQTVRVNEQRPGVELLRMGPQGGTVIPLGQARANPASGGGTTVMQTVQVDARGAVMNEQFASLILARAGQDARQLVGANNSAARKSLPAAQARFSALGTTG